MPAYDPPYQTRNAYEPPLPHPDDPLAIASPYPRAPLPPEEPGPMNAPMTITDALNLVTGDYFFKGNIGILSAKGLKAIRRIVIEETISQLQDEDGDDK